MTIRKQKQIFLYDFELEIYFDATSTEDESVNCKGKIKYHEFNQDDDELQGDITLEKQDDFCTTVRRILKNEMNEVTMKCIHSVGNAMKEKDSDEIKIKMNQAAREEALKKTEEAKEKTDDVKQQIFLEAKKKE